MARYKVLIVEVDGVELEAQTELPLDSDRIYFDPALSGLTATNVQDAIDELVAQTGAASNFSYSTVLNQTITIPIYQQMLVYKELLLSGTGDLQIIGELVIIN